jgi:hypothetical protein
MVFVVSYFIALSPPSADHSGRAVSGINCLLSLERWDRGFEFHLGMDVCVRLFCVCVVLCEGSGLVTGWSFVQGVLPTVYRLGNWKRDQGPQGCRDRRRIQRVDYVALNAMMDVELHMVLEGSSRCLVRAFGLEGFRKLARNLGHDGWDSNLVPPECESNAGLDAGEKENSWTCRKSSSLSLLSI